MFNKITYSLFVVGMICFLATGKILAQQQETKSDSTKELDRVFVTVEQPARLVGGIDSLLQRVNYPETARKAGIEGRVYVKFVVTKEGRVHNPEIIRGIGGGCDKEALRLLKTAEFKPAMHRGKPVNQRMNLPIVFKLPN